MNKCVIFHYVHYVHYAYIMYIMHTVCTLCIHYVHYAYNMYIMHTLCILCIHYVHYLYYAYIMYIMHTLCILCIHYVRYVCMLAQRFEPQGRRFTNFHDYYYWLEHALTAQRLGEGRLSQCSSAARACNTMVCSARVCTRERHCCHVLWSSAARAAHSCSCVLVRRWVWVCSSLCVIT